MTAPRPVLVAVVANALDPGARVLCEHAPGATLAELLAAPDVREAIGGAPEHDLGLHVSLDGEQVARESWGSRVVGAGAQVAVIRYPGDPVSIFTQLLIGVALSVVARILASPPRDLRSRDDEASPVYSFGGIRNNRFAGQPIPLVYGEMRVGGTVIAQSLQTEGWPPRTTLWVLLSLGLGPFDAIAGETEDTPDFEPLGSVRPLPSAIEINGNPVTNFDGVRAWVRMGSIEQEPLPGFAEQRRLLNVDLPLVTEETEGDSGLTALVAGFSDFGDDEFTDVNDALWDASAAGYDLDDQDYDGAVLRIQFPDGMWAQNVNTGALLPVPFRYQIRYRELDGGGNPITTGGYAGDGWVRLPEVELLPLRQRGSFEYSVGIPFLDPQSYAPGLPGGKSSVEGSVSRISSPATAAMGLAAGQQVDHLSAAVWIQIDDLPASPSVGALFILGGDYESATDRGWALFLEYREFPNQGAAQRRWVLTLRLGRMPVGGIGPGPLTVTPLAANNGQSAPGSGIFDAGDSGRWHHVAFTYAANDRVRLFLDGTVVAEEGIPGHAMAWQGGSVDLGAFPRWTGGTTDTAFDQIVVWHRQLTISEMRGVWNFGQGSETALGTDVVLRHEFESPTPGQQGAGTPWYGDAVAIGVGARLLVTPIPFVNTSGVIRYGGTSQRRRGRWRVEVLRTNRTSTNARVAHSSRWLDIQGIVDAALSYPGEALLALAIPASEQLSNVEPTVTTLVRGRRVPVWDGASVAYPTIRRLWSANPAWIALDLLTDKTAGMGRRYAIRDIDLARQIDWARRCDEVLYDGRRSLELDHTGAGDDVAFDESVADATGTVRGQLEVLLSVDAHPSLPVTWEAGRYLRLGGFPTAGLDNDINTNPEQADPTAAYVGGYEIAEVTLVGGQHVIRLWWDRLGESNPWDTGTLMSAALTTAGDLDGALVAGGHPRAEFNGVFDTVRGAWDALLDVAAVGRAAVIQEGRRVRFKAAGPRAVVGLVTPGMITEGSFELEYASPRTRDNALELTILDREAGYENTPVEVPGDSILDAAVQDDIRLGRRELFGVTDSAQARREGAFQLRANRLLLRSGRFTAGPEGLPFEVGDVLRVAHSLAPSRGVGGRVPGASAPSVPAVLADGDDLTDGSWVAGGVSVIADGTEPVAGATAYRLTDASSGALGLLTAQAAIDQAGGLLDGAWCLSFLAAPGTSIRIAARISSTAGSDLTVAFDLSTQAVAWSGGRLKGGGRAVPLSGGWVFCCAWVTWIAARTDERLTFALAPAVGATQGTAASGTGTARFAGVRVTAGRLPASAAPTRMVLLGSDVTIADGVEYAVHVTDEGLTVGSGVLDVALTPPGARRRGDPLWLEADLPFAPRLGAQQVLVADGSELLIELTGQRRRPDLATEFEWVEYRDDVYSDETPPPVDLSRVPAPGSLAGGGERDVPPGPASIVEVSDYLERTGPGRFTTRLAVTWTHDPATVGRVAGTEVLMREVGGGDFRVAGVVSGIGTQADAAFEELPAGTVVELAVRPFTAAGARAGLARASTYVHTIRGLGQVPFVLASAEAQLVGSLALFSWAFASTDDARTLQVECRRGGAWGLGQRVFLSEPGSTIWGPTAAWAGDDEGEITGLHFRVLDAAGQYGPVLSIEWDPQIEQAAPQPALPYRTLVAEAYVGGGGWIPGSPTANDPSLTGSIEEHVDGYLEFGDAGLEGTYVGPYGAVGFATFGAGREERAMRVEAVVDAEIVPPLAAGDGALPWGSAELSRFDVEGPSFAMPGEETPPTLRIQSQMLNVVDGTPAWSAWKDHVPGEYRIIDVRFRLVLTRASTAWNVRVHAFHTRAYAPLLSFEQATPARRHLDSAFFG